MVEKRNILTIYVLGLITFGIYFIWWFYKTKNEINNEFGGDIPSAILMIVPIVNIYFLYKYAENFSLKIKKDDNTVIWAVLFILIGIIAPAIVQSELNKIAK